jgi:DNA-binding beta-propeller fold protein YncE
VRSVAAAVLALTLIGPAARAGAEYDPTLLIYPPFRHSLGFHKVTKFHLFVYLGTRTRFNDPGAVSAVKLDSEDDPGTARDDDELTVFGINTGECEIIYNTSLTSADAYGECGTGPGRFRNPLGVAAERNGNVFVADTGNDRVVQLAYRDDRLTFVRGFGGTGSGERQFRSPSDVAIGQSGTLYIADTGNDRVVLTTRAGEPVLSFRGDASRGLSLDGPTALAVVEATEEWTAVERDLIVVVDKGGTRLVQMSRDGRALAVAEAGGLPLQNVRFNRVAIDFYGNVYATDTARSQIHKFDASLAYVASFGRQGTGRMELDEPRGITIWRRFGQVFVTERAGAQYFWIGTEIRELEAAADTGTPDGDQIRVSYTLTETSRVTIELVDERGGVVGTLLQNRRRAIGRNVERLDAASVAPGLYTLRMTAAPTYSSGTYFQDIAEITLRLPGGGRR